MKHLTIPRTIVYFMLLFAVILSCLPACAFEERGDSYLPGSFQSGGNEPNSIAAQQSAGVDESSQALMPAESDEGDVTGRQVLKAWLDHRRREMTEATGGAPPDHIDEGDLAKQSQNPVANLASLPFQCNAYFGTNPGYRTSYIINIQPVVPFELSKKWTLITRNIVPVKQIPIGEKLSSYGVGDITSSFFFSPVSTGSFTWGAGPVFNVPTATDEPLGTGKWGLGPTGVVVWSKGPWVYGALLNNVWSIGGDPKRKDMNILTCQPFVNYNFKSGYYLSSSPIINADWMQPEKDRWTVPLGLGAGKIIVVGHQPVNISLGAYSNVVKPTNGPDWNLRLSFQFLFAK